MPIKVLQVENHEGNMVFVNTAEAVVCMSNQENDEGMQIGCAAVLTQWTRLRMVVMLWLIVIV